MLRAKNAYGHNRYPVRASPNVTSVRVDVRPKKISTMRPDRPIFPDEIWKHILEGLDDSIDIISLLESFPHLRYLSADQQCSWLIGAVMPLIFPKFLHLHNIKMCRIVSKRWLNAVDTTLETHPDLPFTSSRSKFITETHVNYYKIPYIATNFQKFCHSEFAHRVCIEGTKTKNPFPGRCVHFRVERDSVPGMVYLRSANEVCTELVRAVTALETFGYHIWHIFLEFPLIRKMDGDTLIDKILQPLFQCLSYLPNLKALTLKALCEFTWNIQNEAEWERFQEFMLATSFPFRLESINMRGFRDVQNSGILYKSLMQAFVNHNQVKLLGINVYYWNSSWGKMFPNLKKLILCWGNKQQLECILKDLEKSPIQHLRLDVEKGAYMGDILDVIAPYNIEYLDLAGEIYLEPEKEQGIVNLQKCLETLSLSKIFASSSKKSKTDQVIYRTLVRSVQSLRIALQPTQRFGFSFLKSLPSLKYLTIFVAVNVKNKAVHLEYERSTDPIFKAIYNFYYNGNGGPSNFKFIWDLMPNLRMLTLNVDAIMPPHIEACYQFIRECHRCCLVFIILSPVVLEIM